MASLYHRLGHSSLTGRYCESVLPDAGANDGFPSGEREGRARPVPPAQKFSA
ncbi:MAG: hypothetical protein KME26_29365 [Oscillatoria princeps RMCB-10]|nr:hypothetical protein [Oscillatoria princeps RMCB-10]